MTTALALAKAGRLKTGLAWPWSEMSTLQHGKQEALDSGSCQTSITNILQS
jgi:hypothetical protein